MRHPNPYGLRPSEPRSPLPHPAEATPAAGRRRRIRQLEALARKVAAELDIERAALTRLEQLTPGLGHPIYDTPGAVIRAWATREGLELSPVGKIPYTVRAAYARAHLNPGD